MVDLVAGDKGKQEAVNEGEEVEDYMSATFVAEEPPPPSSSLKRKRERQPPEKKPLKELEKEKRSEGLATAISSDNKGFRMLKMMGYKEGTSLGKGSEEALKEPISIALRPDRSGLGLLENIQRNTERQVRQKKEHDQHLTSTFKDRMKERFEERKVHGQLREAFGICIQLDQEKGLHDSPHLRHHEAEEKRKQEEGDAYEPLMWGAEEAAERLEAVLDHLRSKHLFCFYCGCAFSDEEDLARNCPGSTEADHE